MRQVTTETAGDITSPLPNLVPARILNEFAYCPRLAYIEWVESEFEDNVFTVDGRRVHARVDGGKGRMPDAKDADEKAEKIHARSVLLSAPLEGLIARIDIVEMEGRQTTPVDYKRGKKPDLPEGAWEPERVQLCAQGLILRENGYACTGGVIYYAGSRERVTIPFIDDLVARTRGLIRELREAAKSPSRPEPLKDSPKCGGCSLVDICLPDETVFLQEEKEAGHDGMRRIIPARDDALPLYVQAHGAQVGKKGEVLVVKEKGKAVAESRLPATSQVCLFGNVGITARALQECCQRSIPISHFQYGGWFCGITMGMGHRNAEIKRVQFRAADKPDICLALSRRIVSAKIANQRTIVRRNHPDPDKNALRSLDQLKEAATMAESQESLLGFEGNAARIYFSTFPDLLKPRDGEAMVFDFEGRNRRPPRDPVNALLSFAYAMLVKDLTVTLLSVGLDPYQGFYHKPRFGRPALSLDLMEEFRPIIADSVVLTLVNNAAVNAGGFIRAGGSVVMKPGTKKALIGTYERRMDQLITHPVFGYRISYRRTLEVQSRLLIRYLAGEIYEFPPFLPR